jgi:tRNA (cytidine/uridine-2'-O-)-methyltransferase
LFFGPETRGLPEPLLQAHPERCLRIPMLPGCRSLNLSNAVAIMAYEVLRQQGFPGLQQAGPSDRMMD